MNVSYLVHDSYYKDLSHLIIDERICTNFDHPQSLETSLLLEHIQTLKRGEIISVPQYNFATHTRLPDDQSLLVHPQKIIIIEGILILCHPELVNEMDIKVFVVRYLCVVCCVWINNYYTLFFLCVIID